MFFGRLTDNFMTYQNSELEKFIHEEFESSRHEVIIVIASTHKRSAAVCAFLQEMKVEFFVEKFPDCCLQHFASNNSSKQEIIDQVKTEDGAFLLNQPEFASIPALTNVVAILMVFLKILLLLNLSYILRLS